MTRKEWRGAIIGMVMGDGSLSKNTSGSRYIMSFSHSHKQLEYLKHKLKIVNQIFDYDIPIRRQIVKLKGKSYLAFKVATRVHSRFTFIGKNIYIPKKTITDFVLENITDEGMAYWYMDDGSLTIPKNRGSKVTLGTYGFSLEGVEKLQKFILAKYGVDFNINYHKPSDGHFLVKGYISSLPMLDKLKGYAIPSMMYKFDRDRIQFPAPRTGDDIVHA